MKNAVLNVALKTFMSIDININTSMTSMRTIKGGTHI